MRRLLLPLLLAACAPDTKDGPGGGDDGPEGPGDTGGDTATDTAADTGDTGSADTGDIADSAADPTADADGDGVPDAQDCDPADEDRALDCAEGPVLTLAGARLLEEEGAIWPVLYGVGELAEEAGPELAIVGGSDVYAVRFPDAGDTTLPESALGSVATQGYPYTDAVLGDLDGDGWTDLVEVGFAFEWLSDDPYEEFFRWTPTLTAYLGPLADGPAPAWSTTLDTHTGSSAVDGLVVDDLDGDGVAEVLFTVGTSAPYGGDTAAWRLDAGGTASLLAASDGYVWGELTDARAVGDVDGDGIADLSVESGGAALHLGPLGDALPAQEDAAARVGGAFDFVVGLGDVDGDGRDDVAFRGHHVWIVPGTWSTGDVEALAVARIGPETDESGESALSVVGGDVGADGVGDVVITDTYWPEAHGTEPKRGAVYVFYGMPAGTLDVRAADTRVYGEKEGAYFGGLPVVLDDGRVAVQGYRDRTAPAGMSWAAWMVEGL